MRPFKHGAAGRGHKPRGLEARLKVRLNLGKHKKRREEDGELIKLLV